MVLGEINVDALLRRITAKQFRDWQIYYGLEPFGEERADCRSAQIVQMLFNINRGKDQKALPLAEFLLKFESEPPKKRQPWQEQIAVLKLLAAAHANDKP